MKARFGILILMLAVIFTQQATSQITVNYGDTLNLSLQTLSDIEIDVYGTLNANSASFVNCSIYFCGLSYGGISGGSITQSTLTGSTIYLNDGVAPVLTSNTNMAISVWGSVTANWTLPNYGIPCAFTDFTINSGATLTIASGATVLGSITVYGGLVADNVTFTDCPINFCGLSYGGISGGSITQSTLTGSSAIYLNDGATPVLTNNTNMAISVWGSVTAIWTLPNYAIPCALTSLTINSGATLTIASGATVLGSITVYGGLVGDGVTFTDCPVDFSGDNATGTFSHCDFSAALITTGTYSGIDVTIHYSNFNNYSSSSFAIQNLDLGQSYLVDATNNYWGHPTGPTHPSNPAGQGAAVSDGVDFMPFEPSPLPLPIQLANFTATAISHSTVRLDWTTLTEINNYGFEIQKSDTSQQHYQTIPNSFLPGHGTTNEPQHYGYIDSTATSGAWYYRLKQIDLDGTVHYCDGVRVNFLTSVKEEEIPAVFSLLQNYPNPFNPSTIISYGLPHTSFVTLTVLNTLGQQIAQLVNEQQQAGSHDVVFRGDGLASGVYFYRIQTGEFVASRKLLLLK
ncbi:MAG TPA: hypothetical protein DGH68_13220 [Bacteroidetes bacterium]|nr:hypothetical protein [Bacteroidota bacterium]